ncbi:D-cysteine desulfhydrase [Acerihabitans sp.]|uniref:D-cysteine desulfhydrase n=1 Tax=Acerihabitans sp. TaxID=2811394 RepID=UPI002ED939CE
MHLARFPRVTLGQFPTPLEALPNLSRYLGGPTLYIKRDDNTGLASGGNKTRKLEFLLADAVRQQADVVITQGATQSNHVRQTIAGAAKLGLKTQVLLEKRVERFGEDYQRSGNILLDDLLGGVIVEHLPAGTDMQAAMERLADTLRAQGHRPYVIPGGGSNPIGALGYVACAEELLYQSSQQRLRIDTIVHATGSTGTQAGLVSGLEASNSGIPVLGISVRAPKAKQEENVYALAARTWQLLGARGELPRDRIEVNSDYVGEGYGLPTDGTLEALRLLAQLEGILLDPVYTGKGMAGLIDLVRQGRFKQGENVVFIHTGGSAGLFGYRQLLEQSRQ